MLHSHFYQNETAQVWKSLETNQGTLAQPTRRLKLKRLLANRSRSETCRRLGLSNGTPKIFIHERLGSILCWDNDYRD
jgi:hypothetical protein